MSDGRLRASDGDRDSVVQILNTAYGAGRISAEEHTERVDAALVAKTLDDLQPLTVDLVPSAAPGPRPQPPDPKTSGPRRAGPNRGVSEAHVLSVTMDKLRRSGAWSVPPRLQINGFLATIDLDLTEAELPGHVVELKVNLAMASLRLRVPSGSNVQDSSSRILGDHSIRRVGPYNDRAPLILISGTVLFSDVKVRGPRGQHGLLGALGF